MTEEANETAVPPGMEDARQAPAGVVKPPRDIQAIVEKTAGYVARNGPVFEDRIRDKEKSNPKFSFLTPHDAYAPFYAWRLSEVREGRGTAVSAGRAGEAAGGHAQATEKKGPEPPSEFLFSARMPNISAQDLEVVRLTAFFVATNGKSFMNNLVQREGRNFQFDFLRPQHSLHQFFNRIVDQYTLLLQSSSAEADRARQERIAQLEQQRHDKFAVMERAKKRAAWIKYQQQEKQQKEEAAEREQQEYAQVDWHDFVVVETVEFDDADEQADLPAPTSLNDLQSASLEQKAAMSLQPASRRIEEAMPTSEDYNLFYQQSQQPLQPQMQQQQPPQYPQYPMPFPTQPVSSGPQHPSYGTMPAPSAPSVAPISAPNAYEANPASPSSVPSVPVTPAPTVPEAFANEEENQAIAARTQARQAAQAAQQAAAKGINPQSVRIREDYVPRAQAKQRQNVATAICPNCRQPIPVNELDHHMKVELLDPRWKEQRLKAESRASTTNLSTYDVANNLKRLASQRSDVFDGITGQQPVVDPAEEARRKKIAASGGFDGHLEGSVGNVAAKRAMAQAEAERNGLSRDREKMKGGTIEEQIRMIHERAKG